MFVFLDDALDGGGEKEVLMCGCFVRIHFNNISNKYSDH